MTKMAACNLRASARSAAAHQRGGAFPDLHQIAHQQTQRRIIFNFPRAHRRVAAQWHPEIAVGATILALVGIDYILQTRNDEQRGDMYRQLEREVRRDEATSRREDKKLLDGGAAARAKFQCVVRKVPQNFDGHKCLKNVKVGDVVGVIEEGVGPDGMYNLCSIERGSAKNAGKESAGDEGGKRTSIGWFPCSCLQKIE